VCVRMIIYGDSNGRTVLEASPISRLIECAFDESWGTVRGKKREFATLFRRVCYYEYYIMIIIYYIGIRSDGEDFSGWHTLRVRLFGFLSFFHIIYLLVDNILLFSGIESSSSPQIYTISLNRVATYKMWVTEKKSH